jgi:hypothetical protein
LHLRVSGRQADPARQLTVEADLEGILPGAGQGNIEYQHGPRLDVDHAGRGLAKLDRSLAAQKLGAGLIDEADANPVNAYLGAPAPNPKHQVRAGIDRGKVGEPDVLKHPEHAELSLLVDQGIVGDDREIEMQGSADPD